MAKKSSPNSPLTFDLPVELYNQLLALQKKTGERSVSSVIRRAVDTCDFASLEASREEHRQISVRIPTSRRNELTRLAKKKKVSTGELLRVAIAEFKPAKAKK